MSIEDRIKELKKHRDADLPDWSKLKDEYDKSRHKVHSDIKFKNVSGKNLVKVDYGVQKLMCDRIVQLMNTIPIERVYEAKDEREEEASRIIEAVFADNKIDTENNRRLHAYFASCEVVSMWTGIEQTHNRYGVPCNTRLRISSSSPMERKYSRLNQADLYPVFDDFGDMQGFGIGGLTRDDKEYFTFYTENTIEEYVKEKNGWVGEVKENPIGKIPLSYMFRMNPIYYGQEHNVDTIETIESSQAQIIKRNSAPVLAILGEMGSNFAEQEVDELERKTGVPREIINLTGGGDVKFVESPINADAPDRVIKRIKRVIEEESQLPLDLGLEALQGLGNVSGESLKQVLMGAHLKVGQEQGEVIEFLDREIRVVKELLATALPKYADAIHSVKVENVITPFTMDDESEDLNRNILRLNNKLTSRRELMRKEGISDADKLFDEIIEEDNMIQISSPYISDIY